MENLHPCAKVWSCLATAVEGWCTVDEKRGQVEISGVLLMGVSHEQCISKNWECVCVCVYNMTLLRSTNPTTDECVFAFSVFVTTVLMLYVQYVPNIHGKFVLLLQVLSVICFFI